MQLTVSLVLITGNAEATIGGTLASIKELADEIIVVDTGATDNTAEIASSYNARVFSYKWDNNFSNPRNFGISKATSDWILILDTDERLSAGNILRIKTAISDVNSEPAAGAYVFTQKSAHDSTSVTVVSSIRLFRNIKELRYKYAIHEMVTTENLSQTGLLIKSLDVEIEHSGYQTNQLLRFKEKRNLNILKCQLLKNKLSDDEFFHYAVYFLKTNLCIDKPTTLEKRIGYQLIDLKFRLVKQPDFKPNQDFFIFYSVIGEFLLKYEDTLKINQFLTEATLIYADSPYIFYKYAELYYKLNDYSTGIRLLEKCLSFNEAGYNPELLIDSSILNNASYHALAKCYEKLGEHDKAALCISKVKQ